MQINFTGRNIELTPALKTFTTEKMEKIQQRDHHISNIHVSFHVENVDQIVEATLNLNGANIHATAKADDMYSAIDMLIDKLLGQITKHKEKISGR